jgi:phenylalanine-4-hydroxylase
MRSGRTYTPGVHQPYLLEHICQEWKTGMELLQLDPSGISTVSHLNDRITPRTGWRIEDKFAPAYMKATQEEREVIKRLAWYSTEFGLVVQEQHE